MCRTNSFKGGLWGGAFLVSGVGRPWIITIDNSFSRSVGIDMWSGLVGRSSFPRWPMEIIGGSFRCSDPRHACGRIHISVNGFAASCTDIPPGQPFRWIKPFSQAVCFGFFFLDRSFRASKESVKRFIIHQHDDFSLARFCTHKINMHTYWWCH